MVSIQKIGEIQFDKVTRQAMAKQVINDLAEGTADPVQIHYNIKCLEDLIKQITNDKDPSDMGFVKFTNLIQNTQPLTFSNLFEKKLQLI